MQTSRERVAIDVRYLSHGLIGGVHTYVRNLVSSLLDIDAGLDFALWIDAKRPFELESLPSNAATRQLPWSGPWSSALNDRHMGSAMAHDAATVAHFPANYGFVPAPGPAALITVHDAINLLPLHRIWRSHPKAPRSLLAMTYLHLMTTRSLRRQPKVVTVSKYSKREILRWSRLAEDRVHVVPSAPDPMFRPLPEREVSSLRNQLQLRQRVLLADAIKNPAATLRVWRALPEEIRADTSLVMFARREPVRDVIDTAERGQCVLLQRPSQDELVRLYNLADVFVFPSWYEGFGLPVLEAMACGTPVVCSDRGSLPEVAGDAGIVTDAEDHDAIASAIAAIVGEPRYQSELRQRSIAWSGRFSWERTARETAQLYRTVGKRAGRAETADTASLAAG
jgi:glycosyltransferase involved in cell wall biosynthesis